MELAERDRREHTARKRGWFNFDVLQGRLPNKSPDLLMGLVGELNAMNLVHLPGVPQTRMEGYGNYPIEMTSLGVDFVVRLLTPPDNSAGGEGGA